MSGGFPPPYSLGQALRGGQRSGAWGSGMGPRMREDKEGEVFTPIPRLHEGRL